MSVRCTGERESVCGVSHVCEVHRRERESVCVCGVSHVCEVHRRERECVWSEPCL